MLDRCSITTKAFIALFFSPRATPNCGSQLLILEGMATRVTVAFFRDPALENLLSEVNNYNCNNEQRSFAT